MRRRFVVTALSCVAPLFLVACGKSDEVDPRTAPPIVRIAQVQPGAGGARTFTGTVAARVQSDLAFRVGGKVTERLVETGQTVKRGDVLYRIDPVDLNLAAASQQQAVIAARAQSAQATADEARYRDLAAKGVVSGRPTIRSKRRRTQHRHSSRRPTRKPGLHVMPVNTRRSSLMPTEWS